MQIANKIKLFQNFLPNQFNYLEIGVWKGELSRNLLQTCPLYNNITLVDPWLISDKNIDSWYSSQKISQLKMDEIYQQVKSDLHFAKCLRGTLEEVLSLIDDVKFDLIYIDGDHTRAAVFSDLINSEKLLKQTGVIICDDYKTGKWWGEDVINAVLDFLRIVGGKLEVIDDQAIISNICNR